MKNLVINHPLNIKLTLQPIWHNDPPEIKIYIDDQCLEHLSLSDKTDFEFSGKFSANTHSLRIEFLNKQNSDTVDNKDKAVEIINVSFMNIESQKFIWQGVYIPEYPEPWASEQLAQGIQLSKHLRYQTRLSWNGVWKLTFTVPIFTWIHHVEDLGWIYD